jgi:GYF domain 2
MHHVKMLDELEDVARRAADRWYVTTGNKAVGPVNLDLLARGVEAGKVPLEAFVRHEGWKVWRPLAEVAVFLDGDDLAWRPTLVPGEPTDDIFDGGRPSTPTDFSPTDAIDGASDRREALVLLMTAAVVRCGADAVIVHELDEDCAAAVCAHGPSRREALGMRTPRFDPAVVAAQAGVTVVVEPVPGPAGASVVARLSRLAGPLEGALLIPIRAGDQVTGMIEIGRRARFHAEEIASLTALVDAMAEKLDGGA